MFEVQDLRYATLATVSRCGMIWFSEHVLSLDMVYENYFQRLCNVPLEAGDDDDMVAKANATKEASGDGSQPDSVSSVMQDQRSAASYMRQFFSPDGLVTKALEFANKLEHIMDFTRLR